MPAYRIYLLFTSIGKHTLYIYLYHMLLLRRVPKLYRYYFGRIDLPVIKTVALIFMMIAGSLLLESLFKKINQTVEAMIRAKKQKIVTEDI